MKLLFERVMGRLAALKSKISEGSRPDLSRSDVEEAVKSVQTLYRYACMVGDYASNLEDERQKSARNLAQQRNELLSLGKKCQNLEFEVLSTRKIIAQK